MIKPLTLISLLTTASLSAFADEIPMAELLAKCDGMTRTGTIDPKLKDGVIGGFAEKQCATKASIAQKDASIARNRAEIAKLDEILALLNPAEAKATLAQDISKTEQLLQQARERSDQRAVERHESRLRDLKERQKALK